MIQRLEEALSYSFKRQKLLERALTHASKSAVHLERQEFLGDAILGLVVAEYLFQQYPSSPEGDLSKMRANLVCKQALLLVAGEWKLSSYLSVGDGERTKSGDLKSESIAANAVEAVLGAVFEDGGWTAVKKVVLKAWGKQLRLVKPVNLRDAKSELQELTQSKGLGLPSYEIQDLGVNQSPRFLAECFLGSENLGLGKGNRKKDAELVAAKHALEGQALKQIMG